MERLKYELSVINRMKFTGYFSSSGDFIIIPPRTRA